MSNVINDKAELIRNIIPMVGKEEKQPCRTCIFYDKCDHCLEWFWINKDSAVLICAWRMRDYVFGQA